MMKSYKFLKWALIVAIITGMIASFSLAGCKVEAPSEEIAEEEEVEEAIEEEEPAEKEAEEAEEVVEEKEPVTISWWSTWNPGEKLQEVFEEIVNNYMAENPNVTVDVKWLGRDNLVKVTAALQAGAETPDIINYGLSGLYNGLIKNDLALSLDEYMTENAYGEDVPFIDVFAPGTFDNWKPITDNKIYSIPHYEHTGLLWYDKAKFDKLGITEVPETWDDFLATCEILKENGVAPLVVDGNIDFYCSYYYYWLTNRLLGPKELLMASLDKKGKSWDNPLFLEAAKKIQELVDKEYFIEGYKGYQWPAGQIDWAQGNGGYLLMGTWITVEVQDNLPDDFEVAGIPFPTVDGKGDIHDVELYQVGFAILKNAENPEVCMDFLKYCLTQESQEKIGGAGAAAAVRKGVASNYPFIDEVLNNATSTHAYIDNLPGINAEWTLKVFYPLTKELVHGTVSAEEFIGQIKQQSIDYWANK